MGKWKYRIGSDIWKNFIFQECEAVRKVRGLSGTEPLYADKASEPARVGVPREELPRDKSSQRLRDSSPFCYCFLPPHSYLVFQTGRAFLVGASEEAVGALENLAPADLPHHVVLLTWAESHVSGLEALYVRLAEEKQEPWLTVWTSSWVWEEALRRLNERGEKHGAGVLSRLLRLNLLTPEDAETGLVRNKVVACERQMDVALALGVHLSLYYVPNALPCLQVSFRCNRSRLVLNPMGAVRFEEVREELKKAIHPFPSLQDEFLIRYGTRHTPDPPESFELEGTPVDLAVTDRPVGDVKFGPSTQGRVSPAPLRLTEAAGEEARAVLSKTAVAILCGGLSSKREKELLDPGRRLNVFPKGERTYVLSIIEWRLYQLHLWAGEYGVESLPVLLMTSPDTEAIVHEQVARFHELLTLKRRRYGGRTPLKINYLRQQLVPEVRLQHGASEGGKLFPHESEDGGWVLNARGHLDFLRLLCLWSEKVKKVEGDSPSLCFVIPYNNLGGLFNGQTLGRLAAFAKSEGQLGAEVFRFDPAQLRSLEKEGDPRLNLMSHSVAGSSALFKNRGYPYKDEKGFQPDTYSSHTWYVNLNAAEMISEELRRGPSNRYVLNEREGRLRPQQDLEQATHGSLRVVHIPERGKGDVEAGLYAHSRFLVVRTEDQIRDRQFRKAFDKAIEGDELCRKFKGEFEGDEAYEIFDRTLKEGELPFFETAPVEMPYVWGGTTIHTLKGLPGRRRVAETWEVSTHPAGPSSVYLNLEHPVPLSEVLLKTGDKSGLEFMAKYLDCHDKLSIQVHPNRATAEYLFNHPSRSFRLKDADGKEEGFYVLSRATHHDYHLFLGFERDSLTPLANRLRPILLKYAGRTGKADLWDCYDELVLELRRMLERRCVPDIAEVLNQDTAPFAETILASFHEAREAAEPLLLQNVFRYHVEVGSILKPSSANGDAAQPSLSLLGKEYLFAAVGVIRVIEEVAKLIESAAKEPGGDRNLLAAGRRLFGLEAERLSKEEIKNAPLLKYFHTQEVRAGQWVRIPPGTVHAWQGGGNFLIEVSQCSDNTFRLLDFGRELTESSKRDMHYLAAMYSLSADSILDEESIKRLLFKEVEKGKASKPFQHRHSAMQCRLFGVRSDSQTGTESEPLEDPDWSVVMNPDNPVCIRTDTGTTGGGTAFSEISLGRCRAVLIKPGTRFKCVQAHPDDRFLFISPRVEKTDLVCISLGATKLEVSLYRDGESPPIIWTKGKHPTHDGRGAKYLDRLIEAACVCIGDIVERSGGDAPSRKLRVAVSWPGYIERRGGDRAMLNSSAFDRTELDAFAADLLGRIGRSVSGAYTLMEQSPTNPLILNDAAASALGEYRHPLGWLLEDTAGMVLNIGSGLCAGFYLGASKAAGAGSNDEGAKQEQTKEEEEQKKRERQSAEEEKLTIDACAAVGRWLYIDPRSGRMTYGFQDALNELPSALQQHVFRGRIPPRVEGYLRASIYLSSRGIALRFLSRLSRPEDFAAEIGWNVGKISKLLRKKDGDRLDLFLEGCEVIAAAPDEFDIHRMIHRINMEAVNKGGANQALARELIIEVAQELAELLRQTMLIVQRAAPKYTDCTRRVVLTGAVGEHFGRIDADDWLFADSGNKPPNNVADKDLLIGVLTRCLSSAGLRRQPDKVRRSEVSISSVREIEGFLHYLTTQPDLGGGS